MEYKELGKTGIKIPPVIFGTSALGNLYIDLNENIKLDILRECFKYLNRPIVFDCAGKYGAGLALEMLGTLLNKLNINEKEVIISNKLGWMRTPLNAPEPTFEPGVWKNIKFDSKQEISYNGILACWEQGIGLLGEKYLPQLVSVHDPDEYIGNAKSDNERAELFKHILNAYTALLELKAQGKIKAVGVGAKNWKIIEQISEQIDLDWVMFANSLTIMNHPPNLLNFISKLHNRGIGIINSAVFHAGFLTGGDYYDYKLIKPDTDENKAKFKWRKIFFETCEKYNVLPATACVQFALTPPGIVSISLNTSKPEHVKKNIDSFVAKIPKEFWNEMVQKGLISRDYPYLGI